MATPTLSTINSYSVSNGVTLTFDANSGTNLVRGSILTILDMDSNILATHIYIPNTYEEAAVTHILPSKMALTNESTTPSAYSSSTSYIIDDIVSYNGATYRCIQNSVGNVPTDNDYWVWLGNAIGAFSYISSDFATDYTNETQYQYYIQTFVSYEDDLTLSGESENSNKRSAWTLPQPTVTIDTIGENGEINTTSYTIGVTYDTNIATSIISNVYNPPNFVRFDLYKLDDGDSILYQSSGDVYNGGTMLTPTDYYMNHNFSGMVNGEQYQVKVTVHSLLGMIAIGISNIFTVNADVYEIGAFTTEGDYCNGRIVVQSDIRIIDGRSDVVPENGEIDLTNSTAIWDTGFSFTNNWTIRLWGYDFNVAESVPSEDRILHLSSSTTNGVLDAYMLEDASDNTKVKIGIYIYPTGYANSVVQYYESNSVAKSSITSSTPLFILIGFDYDNTGAYTVKISV